LEKCRQERVKMHQTVRSNYFLLDLLGLLSQLASLVYSYVLEVAQKLMEDLVSREALEKVEEEEQVVFRI
jgi:hypothetical protein